MPKHRRHAAIMFTDIVGYTALMGSDEDKAFELLSKNKEIHTNLIKKHNGKLIKEMGDGMLISFDLASDAVYCAVEIQKESGQEGIPLKIGIHEGETVIQGADVLGDAVNVASRLEADTQKGSITISGKVYSDIKNRKDIQTKFIKEKKFKNVDDPIKVYEVLCDQHIDQSNSNNNAIYNTFTKKSIIFVIGFLSVIGVGLIVWKLLPQNTAPALDKSIAVLPFDYLSEEENKQYLADGVMDAITSNLAKISELKVIAKTSVMKYNEHNIDVRDIGKELDVSYIVEGSFQLVGDHARLIIQLINTIDGSHIWSDEYDREWADIFKVQSEVSQKIANEIAVNITPETKILIDSPPTNDLTAYDFYLRGEDYLNRTYFEEDYVYAMKMFKKAIEIDSNFTLAWVGMAASSRSLYWFYYDHSNERIQTTKLFLTKALKLDSELEEVKVEQAKFLYHCERRYEDALAILNNLKNQYPKNHDIYYWIGVIFKRMGDFENSLEYYNYAIKLNPSDWRYRNDAGIVYLFKGDYDHAEIYFTKSMALNPSEDSHYRRLLTLYAVKGEWERLKIFQNETELPSKTRELELLEHLLNEDYQSAMDQINNSEDYTVSNQFEYYSRNFDLGMIYLLNSNNEKAKEYFNKEKSFLENLVVSSPEDYRIYKSLGIVYAVLGEKQNARDAGEKMVQLMGTEKDAIYGVLTELCLARMLLLIEQYEEGISKLEYLLENTGRISVEYLRGHYLWKGFMKNEKYSALVSNPKYQIENLHKNN